MADEPIEVAAWTTRAKCSIHPGYRTGRPPKTSCITCWALYGRRRAVEDGLRSVGRARGGGQSSKAKGREAVQVVRALLLRAFPDLGQEDVFVKAGAQGGTDLHCSPAVQRYFPFAVEVKCQESLNIWAALRQAAENAGGRPPIVFFRRARTELYVALRAEDFVACLPWPKSNPTRLTPENKPVPTDSPT